MLNILMVSPWLPWPPHDGARIRILETLKFLSARHRVTFLAHVSSTEEGGHVDQIREICHDVQVVELDTSPLPRTWRMARGLFAAAPLIQSMHSSAELARTISRLTEQTQFDIVHIELSMTARYVRAIHPSSQARSVLSTHNIESERFRRELKIVPWGARRLVLEADALLFPTWEQRSLRRFDGAVAVSQSDADWIKNAHPGAAVRLAPNGVDTRFYHPGGDAAPADPTLVFTGVMDYPPNVDAVIWFSREIWPDLRQRHPDLSFEIVGAKPTAAVKALQDVAGVRVVGEVADIRPYVQRAVGFVVPLRSGGGTRLKILQAMALGCPVVSTALGAEGLDVADAQTILFAEASADFVEQVGRIRSQPDLRQRLVTAGRALVMDRYDWQACLVPVEDLYREVLDRKSP